MLTKYSNCSDVLSAGVLDEADGGTRPDEGTTHILVAFGVPKKEKDLPFMFEQVYRLTKRLGRGRARRRFRLAVCSTTSELKAALQASRRVDVLHIIAHGGAGGTEILLPKSNGHRHPLRPADLQRCLAERAGPHGAPPPRVVFLDNCDSASFRDGPPVVAGCCHWGRAGDAMAMGCMR